jgi:hypothetical protein
MSEVIDLSGTVEAKSDQLNAMDLVGEKVLKITKVTVASGEQPISIFFEGDNNKPWKPCLGQRRILIDKKRGWDSDGRKYVGRTIIVYNEPSVMWAGKPYGGIRICAMSDIEKDFKAIVTLNGKVRIEQPIKRLNIIPLKAITADELKLFTGDMEGCESMPDLELIGKRIGAGGFDVEGTKQLKALYRTASARIRSDAG